MIRRSHTSILSWFRSLSFLFIDKGLKGKVKLLLIDDTRVEVGGMEMVLFVASEPILRRIAYMRFLEAANIFTASTFMKKVKALYRSRMEALTDGAQYYRTACEFLNLDHDVYGLKARNLMERIIQYVKDRTRDFDDHIPCRRKKCARSMLRCC
jgi:putative transposase